MVEDEFKINKLKSKSAFTHFLKECIYVYIYFGELAQTI